MKPTEIPHGWDSVFPRLYIGPILHRKRVALFTVDGRGVVTPRAYFISDQDAVETVEILNRLILPEATE